MNIVTEYPGWLLVLCILSGGAYAFLLYYRNKKEEFSQTLSRVLAFIRFVAITIIAFLLLSPLLKSNYNTSEKPLIIIAQDNSNSLLVGQDSSFIKTSYPAKIEELAENLQNDYDVRIYSFSDKVNEGGDFNFTGKQTNISALFDEMITRYSNRNVGAMLLATDGIYNKGVNPVYGSEKVKFPVYTLALGDTTIRKDIFIRKVNFNRMAYLGNLFPVEILVGANRSKGLSSVLTVVSKGKVLFTKNLTFTNEIYSETVLVQLNATEAGMQRYQVRIAQVSDEISTANNVEEFFVDVLDARQKILLLSASPHPDIAALKEAIESNYNYEVSRFMMDDFTGKTDDYNLIIMHQLPGGKQATTNIIAQATASKIPVLFIIGAQSDLAQFNQINTGLKIETQKTSFNEILPANNDEFALFTMSETTRKGIVNFPPLVSPFGDFKMLNSSNVLFYQQIGSLKTNYPLVIFNQNLENKTGVIAGEGIWRWRLADYLKNGNHDVFNELITKIVQYLSVRVDKSFFRVVGSNNFLENEPVEFDAEVYNQSYELINEPDVEMTITNSEGNTFPFVFSKTAKSYHLNAGMLPVDTYVYEASVRVGEKIFKDAGEFTVSPLNIETVNLIADHNLLYQIAQKHDGQMLSPATLDQFPEMLKNRDDIKTIVFSEKRYSELVNVFWVLVLILALISAEWFIRKRNGSY